MSLGHLIDYGHHRLWVLNSPAAFVHAFDEEWHWLKHCLLISTGSTQETFHDNWSKSHPLTISDLDRH